MSALTRRCSQPVHRGQLQALLPLRRWTEALDTEGEFARHWTHHAVCVFIYTSASVAVDVTKIICVCDILRLLSGLCNAGCRWFPVRGRVWPWEDPLCVWIRVQDSQLQPGMVASVSGRRRERGKKETHTSITSHITQKNVARFFFSPLQSLFSVLTQEGWILLSYFLKRWWKDESELVQATLSAECDDSVSAVQFEIKYLSCLAKNSSHIRVTYRWLCKVNVWSCW